MKPRKIKLADLDLSLSDIEIARRLMVSRKRVRKERDKFSAAKHITTKRKIK